MNSKVVIAILGIVKTMLLQMLAAVKSGQIDEQAMASKFDEVTQKSGLLPLLSAETVSSTQSAAERRDQFIKKYQKPAKSFEVSVLGVKNCPGLAVRGFAERNEFVPSIGNDYYLRPELIRVMVGWLLAGPMQACLHLFGPTGAGKTTFPMRIAELLNIPTLVYTCHERTEMADLFGHFIANENGGMVWKDGPLTLACRAGWWVIINEIDYANPAVAAGLNDVCEGRGFYLPETNEYIGFHPDARIIFTSNTSGLGDHTGGSYTGTQAQNLAFLDRMMSLEVGYMEAARETELVIGDLGPLSGIFPDLAGKMVNVATSIRNQFMGVNGANTAIEVTLSTRALRRWATLILLFKDYHAIGIDPIQYGLDLALANKASAPTRQAIAALVQTEIGSWKSIANGANNTPAQATGT